MHVLLFSAAVICHFGEHLAVFGFSDVFMNILEAGDPQVCSRAGQQHDHTYLGSFLGLQSLIAFTACLETLQSSREKSKKFLNCVLLPLAIHCT